MQFGILLINRLMTRCTENPYVLLQVYLTEGGGGVVYGNFQT